MRQVPKLSKKLKNKWRSESKGRRMNQEKDINQKKLYLDTNLQIVFGVTLMAVLGVFSITPAFPTIIQELGVSSLGIGLLITVFTFPGVILTPVLEVFADRYGRKRVLVPSSLKNPEPKIKQHLKDYFRNVFKSINNRQVIGIFVGCIVTFIILYGTFLTYFPLLLGNTFDASPLIIGLLISVMSLTTAYTASQQGKLSKIYSERTLLKATFLLYGLALLMIPFIPNLTTFLIPIVIYGVAHGLNFPCFQTLLAGLAPMEYRGHSCPLMGWFYGWVKHWGLL
jgi:MFS family permease